MRWDKFLNLLGKTRRYFDYELIETSNRIYSPNNPNLYVNCFMICAPMPNGSICGLFEAVHRTHFLQPGKPIIQNHHAGDAMGLSKKKQDCIWKAYSNTGMASLRSLILQQLRLQDIPISKRLKHRICSNGKNRNSSKTKTKRSRCDRS